jgi:hypothetical protein
MDGFCFFCTVYLILSGLTPRHLEIQPSYHLSGIYERYLPLSRVETNPSISRTSWGAILRTRPSRAVAESTMGTRPSPCTG